MIEKRHAPAPPTIAICALKKSVDRDGDLMQKSGAALNNVPNDESAIDVEAVKRNAAEQGIALREIAIFYTGLTSTEKLVMQERNLLKYESGDTAVAEFTDSGEALFCEKITGFHYLGA